MNVLKQIDECFSKYVNIYGTNDIDSNWDDGIVINKYIKLGNEENELEQKEKPSDELTNEKCNEKEKEEIDKVVIEENTNKIIKNQKTHNLIKEAKPTIKKKKKNLFVINDIVEKCICLNNIDTLEKVKDEALVRWTCMVQQIIAPESYLGIYRIKNKINGDVILRSSKYRDYIDIDENHEMVMDEVEKSTDEDGLEFNFKKYYGEHEEERERKKEQAIKEIDKKKKQKERIQKKALKEIKKEKSEQGQEQGQEQKQIEKKNNISINNFCPTEEYQSDNVFKKYWRRYLFFCTDIPGSNSEWCKELSEYSSSHQNLGNFLKTKKDFETEINEEDKDIQHRVYCSSNSSSSSSSSCCSQKGEKQKNGTNIAEKKEEKKKKKKGSHKNKKKEKIKCVIKIYDDNCQYNGKNEKCFIKLNDVIEIIGIYRKHQIRDYDDYKKNYNFYFYYDQNFLKYSCIHVFQYTKINYFNPINTCILFKNDLSDILKSGPFANLFDLRKHLLIFISKSFFNDLLVAYYFFFYLTGNYIKESKLKLGKVSLNVFNIFYEEEELQRQLEREERKREQSERKKQLDITKVKSEFEKNVKAGVSSEIVTNQQVLKKEVKEKQNANENEQGNKQDEMGGNKIEEMKIEETQTEKQETQTEKQETQTEKQETQTVKQETQTVKQETEDNECSDEEKKKEKKRNAKHARRINRLIKALVPVYRYIPLLLKQLSKKYLVSVMDHETDKLQKGKLQVINNTYINFDECLLDVGKLNHVSLKNFQCIERLIVSQEIPFIFNTDITFETQTNILILSKKQSMYRNYVDVTIPILYQNKDELFEKTYRTVNMQMQRKMLKKKKENLEISEKETTEEIEMKKKIETAKIEEKYKSETNNQLDYSIFSKEFINTDQNYQPTKKELIQFRRYINYLLSKNHAAKIDHDVTNYITESFVTLRQKHKEINQFVLNSWVCMARILAFSEGYVDIKKCHWDFVMKLENERRIRIQNINKIYI